MNNCSECGHSDYFHSTESGTMPHVGCFCGLNGEKCDCGKNKSDITNTNGEEVK